MSSVQHQPGVAEGFRELGNSGKSDTIVGCPVVLFDNGSCETAHFSYLLSFSFPAYPIFLTASQIRRYFWLNLAVT
jgi:hypothetical protein